jgi:hypothetical protein
MSNLLETSEYSFSFLKKRKTKEKKSQANPPTQPLRERKPK